MNSIAKSSHYFPEGSTATRYHGEWLIAIGALLMLLGVVAIAAPIGSSVTLAWLMGALFLATGIAQFVSACWLIRESGRISRFLLSALAIVAGVISMRNPVAGAMGVTLALAFYLIASSVGKFLMAFEIKPAKGWGLLLVSSAVSLILGVILIAAFPTDSLMVPGLFFGIDLIFFGASLVSFAFVLRKHFHDVFTQTSGPEIQEHKIEERKVA